LILLAFRRVIGLKGIAGAGNRLSSTHDVAQGAARQWNLGTEIG
jgi:hypothetical protein